MERRERRTRETKTKTKVFILFLGLIVNLMFLFNGISKVYGANWVEDWLNSTIDTANVAEPAKISIGAVRNYYSLGGAYIRWKTADLKPFSVMPPRISVGCGGIDAFWGSFSVMDFDYAVNRLKEIIYSAAPFAFFYALGTLCEKCKQILTTLDNAANFLNQISLDTCQAGKVMAAYLVNAVQTPPKEHLGNLQAKLKALGSGVEGYWDQLKNFWKDSDNTDTVETNPDVELFKEMDNACALPFKDMFDHGKVISVLELLADEGVIDGDFEDLIRGIIGDVVIVATNGNINVFYYPGCQQKFSTKDWIYALLNDQILIFDDATLKSCVSGGTDCGCTTFDGGSKIRDYVKNALLNYKNKLESKTAFDLSNDEDKKTVAVLKVLYEYSWQAPVYGLIKQAYMLNIPLSSLIHENSVLVECASVVFAKSLIENIFASAGYIAALPALLNKKCKDATDTEKCIICKPTYLNMIKGAAETFMKIYRYRYNNFVTNVDAEIRNKCSKLITIAVNMQELDRITAKWAFAWTMLGE